MHPLWITISFLLQVVLLVSFSGGWSVFVTSSGAFVAGAAAFGLAVSGIAGMMAYTRQRWDNHLDMFLIMLGPGGLGMLLPNLWQNHSCVHQTNWLHYFAMSGGMWLFTLVPMWRQARCVVQARNAGLGPLRLGLDAALMQAAMALLHLLQPHLPLARLPMNHPALPWISHGLMLLVMSAGMLLAALWFAAWERQSRPVGAPFRGANPL